eukprot:3160785-Ditylum_brightwellii.AAC.2
MRGHNKKAAEIHTLSGDITTNHVFKAIINAKGMAQMWKKIGFADKKRKENNLTSIQVPASWPDTSVDITP